MRMVCAVDDFETKVSYILQGFFKQKLERVKCSQYQNSVMQPNYFCITENCWWLNGKIGISWNLEERTEFFEITI